MPHFKPTYRFMSPTPHQTNQSRNNHNRWYALILLLLMLVSAWVLYQKKQPQSTLRSSDTAFAFTDTTAINKISLTDNRNNTIELSRNKTNDQWMVNGRYLAKPYAVHQLLRTIAGINVQSPVAYAALPHIQQSCQTPDKVVSIFTDNDRVPAKKYAICGLTSDKQGTYALLDGATKPYVVQLLGVTGHLLTRYSTHEPDWRDLTVFNISPNDIKAIELNYDQFFPDYSFRLTQTDSTHINVQALHPSSGANSAAAAQPLNLAFAQKYVRLFSHKNAEAYANEHPRLDSIQQSKPFCTINVSTRNGKTQTVPIHYMPINRRSKLQVDAKGKALQYDNDRFFAFIHQQGDMVMVQQYNFGDIFQRYTDFFGKQSTTTNSKYNSTIQP